MRISGDLAVITGALYFRAQMPDSDSIVTNDVFVTRVLMRKGDEWRFILYQATARAMSSSARTHRWTLTLRSNDLGSVVAHQMPCAFLMISAARSPITTQGAIVLPLGTLGMIEASAIRNRSMP